MYELTVVTAKRDSWWKSLEVSILMSEQFLYISMLMSDMYPDGAKCLINCLYSNIVACFSPYIPFLMGIATKAYNPGQI